MKIKTVFTWIVLGTLAPLALATQNGSVNCSGSGTAGTLNFTLTLAANAAPAVSAIYTGERNFTAQFNPTYIEEVAIGHQRLNFYFTHHNSTFKLIADGDIYGRSGSPHEQESAYRGIALAKYNDGVSDDTYDYYGVTCTYTAPNTSGVSSRRPDQR